MHNEGKQKGITFVRYLQGLEPRQPPVSITSLHLHGYSGKSAGRHRLHLSILGKLRLRLLRKLRESLLRELERIRTNVHRPLERTVNFRHGNENQRQQKREDQHENEM
jgi:hypothetical protein